ncbi:MAG: hypothetical protein ACLQBU_07980 [Terriglobales bacterium]
MRKYLGVLAGVAALCVMSWAQAPTQAPAPAPDSAQAPAPAAEQAPAPAEAPPPKAANSAPPQYARIELFGGGSYAQAGFFNAGHWAELPGWDASLGVNATSWLGLVLEGGQFFGTSKIPRGTPAPFPSCPNFCPAGSSDYFGASTREYNFLYGVHFARRKYERWTPFGELLYGHQGVRGQASGGGATAMEVGTGRALVAGGGLDKKINERFALRFKADYFQTGTNFSLLGKEKQDNFRFSVGIVIRNVHKEKRTLEDETGIAP